ncbi:MAG TPA: nuclear transport factor 2 family protein [Vicinamibacteria bacterium]|nr:nuclear transport factor 2 family protein [Vicinamibacteria bacterium]
MVAAVACLATLLFTPPTAAAPAWVEAEIRAVETARRRAYLAGDYDAVAKLLADDFFLTNAQGVTRDKKGVVELWKSGDMVVQSLDFSDLVIRAAGPVAVVTGKSTVVESYRGEDRSGDQRFTRVYVKRDGRWLLWVYQLTRVPAAR